MCGHHGSSNTNNYENIPTHLGFATSAIAPRRLLYPVHRRASAIESVGLRNHRPQRSCTGRGWIRFLEAIFATARSLHQVLHHDSSNSSSVAHRGLSHQHEFHQADRRLHSIIVIKVPQVTYDSSQIMTYIFNMLICLGMILLDNLLQYLLFIADKFI
jgi:hypothetical protein